MHICIYIYIYICIYVIYMCVYIYMYIYACITTYSMHLLHVAPAKFLSCKEPVGQANHAVT